MVVAVVLEVVVVMVAVVVEEGAAAVGEIASRAVYDAVVDHIRAVPRPLTLYFADSDHGKRFRDL